MKCYLLPLYSTQIPYGYSTVMVPDVVKIWNTNEIKLSIFTCYCEFPAS